MMKEWNAGKIDVYFEDVANEKMVKRSFPNAVENVTALQVSGFTSAIDSLTVLPTAHTIVVEEYKYVR